MKRLFMPTNHAMERAVSVHADLIVGQELPEELASFLAHVAAATLLMNRWRTYDPTMLEDFEAHRVRYPHPLGLKNYLRAAFKVLKEAQQAMLADPKMDLDERQLVAQIELRIAEEAKAWRTQGPSYSDVLGQAGA